MSLPARQVAAAPDLGSLDAITQAVEGGLGLPEVVRAAARALDASLVLIDRSSGVLAVAARSSAGEGSLMGHAPRAGRPPGWGHPGGGGGRRVGRPPAPPGAFGRAAGRAPTGRDHADRLGGRAP